LREKVRAEYLTIDDVRVCFYDLGDMCFDEVFFLFDDLEVYDTAWEGSSFDENPFPILPSGETYSSVSDFVYFYPCEDFGHFGDNNSKVICL